MLKMFKLQIILDRNVNKKYLRKIMSGYLILTHNVNQAEGNLICSAV